MLMPELVRRIHKSFLEGEFEGDVPLSALGVRLWKWRPVLPEATPWVIGVGAWLASVAFAGLLLLALGPLGGLALLLAVFGAVAFPVMNLAWKAIGVGELYRSFTETAARFADEMDERVTVHCPQCGGHAAVGLAGMREATPCPWCDAPLELPKEQHGWIQTAARALEKRYAGSLDAFVASLSGRRGPGALARGLKLPAGYVYEGFVVFGKMRGFEVREYAEDNTFTAAQITELVAPTGLPGEALWIGPGRAADVRRAASTFRVRLPSSVDSRPDSNGWLHDTDPRFRVPTPPQLMKVLKRIGAKGALLVDPGGVTVWRFKGGVEVPGETNMAEFHGELAALVTALGAKRARPGGSASR